MVRCPLNGRDRSGQKYRREKFLRRREVWRCQAQGERLLPAVYRNGTDSRSRVLGLVVVYRCRPISALRLEPRQEPEVAKEHDCRYRSGQD